MLATLFASLGEAEAGREISEYEYSLRFPAATSRFGSYPDVAALGGAQAGSEWSSSINPASAAWPHPERKFRHGFSAQFATVAFAEGTRLDVYAEAPVIDAGAWGVFLPAAAQIRSNHATIRKTPALRERLNDPLVPSEDFQAPGRLQSSGFEFEADFFQLQWGKLVGERTALGAMVGFTSSTTRFDADGFEVVRSRSETYTFRLGAVHQPLEKIRIGAVADYAAAPARTRIQGVNPFTGAPFSQRVSDTTHQLILRTGLTWEYAKGCDFYVDYHGGGFWDDSGEFFVHRFPIGIEQALIPDILFGRVGATFDTRGDTVFTAGLGVTLSDRASLDMAYQGAAFPEIRPEFGAADTFVFSLAIGF